MNDRARIAIVDDDESVRGSLPFLLGVAGLEAVAFASAADFLDSGRIEQLDCLILDVAMPGMSGPELQLELTRRGYQLPIIFITAHSIESLWPELSRHGAVAHLVKPFSEDAILDAIRTALRQE